MKVHLMIRLFLGFLILVALLIAWMWWNYRPTLEYMYRGSPRSKNEHPK